VKAIAKVISNEKKGVWVYSHLVFQCGGAGCEGGDGDGHLKEGEGVPDLG
jgi:hypothetical protein